MSTTAHAADEPLLSVSAATAGYGSLQVLWGVDLQMRAGEAVALIGANGAGKTTLLRTIAGLLPTWTGTIRLGGRDLAGVAPHRRVGLGVVVVPEGRQMFTGLTVRENLLMGAFARKDKAEIRADLRRVEDLFPMLAERQRQLAGHLSGGEQQMCAIARALMARPKVLLVDELSLGLAPVIVDRLVEALREVHQSGIALLVVEQDVTIALSLAQRAYVLENGRIVVSGGSRELASDPRVREAFMGI